MTEKEVIKKLYEVGYEFESGTFTLQNSKVKLVDDKARYEELTLEVVYPCEIKHIAVRDITDIFATSECVEFVSPETIIEDGYKLEKFSYTKLIEILEAGGFKKSKHNGTFYKGSMVIRLSGQFLEILTEEVSVEDYYDGNIYTMPKSYEYVDLVKVSILKNKIQFEDKDFGKEEYWTD